MAELGISEPDTRDARARAGFGPWVGEPDRLELVHAGLPCLLVRHETSLHWCGYAAVPPGHPLHGKASHEDTDGLTVHGGITYASGCAGHVCHKPAPGEPDDVWWFGFDCAHAGDLSPAMAAWRSPERQALRDEVYRDIDYVIAEVRQLAEQLAAKGVAHA